MNLATFDLSVLIFTVGEKPNWQWLWCKLYHKTLVFQWIGADMRFSRHCR